MAWDFKSCFRFVLGNLALVSVAGLTTNLKSAGLPEVASQPVGIYKISLSPGANFISAPLHRIHTFRGLASTITTDSLTVNGNPSWTANQFAPQDGFWQFILLVRKSISAGNDHEGDWWPILGNSANNLTLNNRSEDLTSILSPGDHIEIRRLTSLKDLFRAGSQCILNKDTDFDVISSQEDIIRIVQGTSFTDEAFYHDGSLGVEGYYFNGNPIGTGDGSSITILPGQPIMIFRKTGSPPASTSVSGMVQMTALNHYLNVGANPVGSVFPTNARIDTSGLKESGWISDSNFDILVAEEDVIRTVVGTSFGDEIFHYGGLDDVNGWYANGSLNDAYAFEPSKGYMFFIKGPSPLVWRQTVPFGQ